MLEDRVNDLEIKFTFQEDLLAELNKLVTDQQFVIDSLVKQVKRLKEELETSSLGDGAAMDQEKPPHY